MGWRTRHWLNSVDTSASCRLNDRGRIDRSKPHERGRVIETPFITFGHIHPIKPTDAWTYISETICSCNKFKPVITNTKR